MYYNVQGLREGYDSKDLCLLFRKLLLLLDELWNNEFLSDRIYFHVQVYFNIIHLAGVDRICCLFNRVQFYSYLVYRNSICIGYKKSNFSNADQVGSGN